MSASDDIKAALVEQYPGTTASKWKRASKKKALTTDGVIELRVFEHPAFDAHAPLKVVVNDEDVHGSVDVAQGVSFDVVDVSEEESEHGETFTISIGPNSPWSDRSGVVDAHLLWLLEGYFGIPEGILAEPVENTFTTIEDLHPRNSVITILTNAGLTTTATIERSEEDTEFDASAFSALAKLTGVDDWVFHPVVGAMGADDEQAYYRSPSKGYRAVVSGESAEYGVIMHTAEPMYFYVEMMDDDFGEDDEQVVHLMFANKSYWDQNKAIPDWHLVDMIAELYDLADDNDMTLDEVCENQTIVNGVTLEEARAIFEKAGLVYNERLKFAGQGG